MGKVEKKKKESLFLCKVIIHLYNKIVLIVLSFFHLIVEVMSNLYILLL